MSDILERRLRQVLELLADAPIESTTIPGDAGNFIGDDWFLSVKLKDQANHLLAEWDKEDLEDDRP